MSDSFSFGELEVVATMEESPGLAEPEPPFRIALMGDWSGRANRRREAERIEPEERQPVLIDRDNFDEVLASLNVVLRLPVGEGDSPPHLTLHFQELDDFHPDRIYERLELFDALRETRERLENPSTFAEAAREVRAFAGTNQEPETADTSRGQDDSHPSALPAADGASLLDQMLAETESASPAAATPPREADRDDDLQAMLREIVRPHVISFDDAEQAELVSAVDVASARLMRSILHHADFQSLEAAWRAASLLVSRLETGTDLKLYLLDVTKDELSSDLGRAEQLEETGFYKLLVEQSVNTFGGDLWSVLAGNYTFEATRSDARTLGRIAKIARRSGAPFIAAANSGLIGCDSLAETPDPDDWRTELDNESNEAWNALRSLPEASSIGLALPRFLLRLPYGARTEPTERFDFEELPEAGAHENYLWGNPAFACALLLGQAFTEYGWNLQPGILQDIEDLPLHTFEEDGDAYIKPCAETLLTMRAAERILNQGLMPLLSFQGSDRVRLARFQSLANPAMPLQGRWSA